jgi:hypothetical protein
LELVNQQVWPLALQLLQDAGVVFKQLDTQAEQVVEVDCIAQPQHILQGQQGQSGITYSHVSVESTAHQLHTSPAGQ